MCMCPHACMHTHTQTHTGAHTHSLTPASQEFTVFLSNPDVSSLPGQVILTAEVSGGSRGGRVFRSSDFAKNFVQTDLPFHPLTQMMYSPQNSDYLLALSTEVSPVELAFPCLQCQNVQTLKSLLAC